MLEATVCKNNALPVRELLLGPKRFGDLCADLPGEKRREGLERWRLNNAVGRGVRRNGQTIHAFAGIPLNVAILIAVFWLRRSSV